jgi:hypothetical protein
MKSKEIFSLAVQLLGLVFLYQGLSALPEIMSIIPPNSAGNFVSGIIMCGWPLFIAYCLLRGASKLTRFTYPDSEG